MRCDVTCSYRTFSACTDQQGGRDGNNKKLEEATAGPQKLCVATSISAFLGNVPAATHRLLMTTLLFRPATQQITSQRDYSPKCTLNRLNISTRGQIQIFPIHWNRAVDELHGRVHFQRKTTAGQQKKVNGIHLAAQQRTTGSADGRAADFTSPGPDSFPERPDSQLEQKNDRSLSKNHPGN